MKKGRVMVAVVLTIFLVLAVGIVSATIGSGCHCYAACYYCDWQFPNDCSITEGYGACFCHRNPCELVPYFLCCPNNPQ